jgi:hypothetical protein
MVPAVHVVVTVVFADTAEQLLAPTATKLPAPFATP